MVNGRKPKETAALTEVLHGGTNEGESPDDDDVVYAMVARVSEAEGLCHDRFLPVSHWFKGGLRVEGAASHRG